MINSCKIIGLAFLFAVVASVQAQTAKINKVKTEHNVLENGQKGMRIYADFTVSGMQDKQGRCNAWFYYANEESLQAATYSKNVAPNGNLVVYKSFTPKYENSTFRDFKLFLPYKELEDILNSRTELLFFIGIDDHNGYSLVDSQHNYFNFSPTTNSQVNNFDQKYRENVKPHAMSKESIEFAKKNNMPYITDGLFTDDFEKSSAITTTGSNVTPTEAQEALAFHNQARTEVGVAPLIWSVELSRYAQEWANYLANNYNCEMYHRGELGQKTKNYGENLYQANSNYGKVFTALDASKSWYSEIKDFKNSGYNSAHATGHYTQMIWHNTTELGMGVAKCTAGKYIIVANYTPPGNYIGQKAY